MCGTSDTSKKESIESCCTCGCCGCGCGPSERGSGFKRRFWTTEEKKECLDAYKTQLTRELAALDESIQEGCC